MMRFFVRVNLPSDFWRAVHCFPFPFLFPCVPLGTKAMLLAVSERWKAGVVVFLLHLYPEAIDLWSPSLYGESGLFACPPGSVLNLHFWLLMLQSFQIQRPSIPALAKNHGPKWPRHSPYGGSEFPFTRDFGLLSPSSLVSYSMLIKGCFEY